MTLEEFLKQHPSLANCLKWFLQPHDIVYDVVFQDGRWEATVGIERAEFEVDIAFTGPCQAVNQTCDRVWHWEPCRTTVWTDEDGRYCELKE
jgi:hypothetical protein